MPTEAVSVVSLLTVLAFAVARPRRLPEADCAFRDPAGNLIRVSSITILVNRPSSPPSPA